MKRVSLFILCILFSQTVNAQNEYYDAVNLANSYKENGNQFDADDLIIFDEYFEISAPLNAANQEAYVIILKDSLRTNPFLKDFQFSTDDLQSVESLMKYPAGLIGSIGGLNVTSFADGAAQFLIKRSKQEIAITFFKQFEEKLRDTHELTTLFPQTLSFINLFPNHEYAKMLNALRDAFIFDIENLPNTIPELDFSFFNTTRGKLFLTSLDMVEPIKNGKNFDEILDEVLENQHFQRLKTDLDDSGVRNIQPSLELIKLISKSLRNRENNRVWVNYSELSTLTNNPLTFQIYLGLIYQLKESKEITFYTSENGNLTFREILEKTSDIQNALSDFYNNLNSELQTLNNYYSNLRLKTSSDEKLELSEVVLFTRHLTDVLSVINSLNAIEGLGVSDDFTRFLSITNGAINFTSYLEQKKYSAAIFELSNLLEESGINFGFKESFLKYGTFMASVAEAESSTEVQAAIEVAALPAGSSRIKRQTKWNISINSYLGGFYGHEKLRERSEVELENRGATSFGVSAPIGITISRGLAYDTGTKSVNSLSAFLSLIDIGAFASYRFQNENIEELPEFTLQNILAPGIFGQWNIGGTPFTLGAGGQLGPQLRKIRGTEDESTITTSAWRVQASLTVDIPLFNIKTVPWD